MYSKAEAAAIKKEFWTSFGLYMKPVTNAEGELINWINYKTGVKHIYFRLDAGTKKAAVSIELTHPTATGRLIAFNKLRSVITVFSSMLSQHWNWQQNYFDEDGSTISKIFIELEGVNIFNKESWPAIISFFKEQMIKLDEFWSLVKVQFEE